MPNNFQKVTWVTMESLRRLVNKLEIAKYFNTDMNREYTKPFAVGATIYPKLPQRFTVRDGITYTPQPIDRKTTQVTMDQIFGIDFDYDSVEKALEMERGEDIVRREYIEPAMDQLAQEIDSRCAEYAYLHSPNIVGAVGTTPTAISTFHTARQYLVEMAVGGGTKGMIVSPAMHATLGANLTTMLNPQKELSDLFQEGLLGNAAGFKWHESVSLYDHTLGTMTASDVTVSVTLTDGASSVVLASASAGATLKKGDVINFTTPMACNPGTRRSVGRAKTVVLTADCTIVGGSTATAYFEPKLYGPGSQYQNVDVLPTAAHVVVLAPGTTTPSAKHGIQALAIHRDAFALVSVKLEEPKAVEIASTKRDPKSGISISFVRQFEGRTRTMINRFDVLMGFGCLYPENCSVRVASLL